MTSGTNSKYAQGGDQVAVKKIADAHFGGYSGLLDAHGWERTTGPIMNDVSSGIVASYDRIENFERHFADKSEYGSIPKQILRESPNVILSDFDWEPEKWGCDWYNSKEEADRFLRITEPGVISLAVQDNHIVGAYQLTHVPGDISDFSADKSETNYAFKAYRAWTFAEPPLVTDILNNSWENYKKTHHEMVKVSQEEARNLLKLKWERAPLHAESPFDHDPSVWITSFWGWSPKSWGCVGFTSEARPKSIKKATTNPFLMVIYVTETAPGNSTLKGKVAGFYELSHDVGLKEDYISPDQMNAAFHTKEKWEHSFKALRAWEIDDDFKPTIREFHPELVKKKQQQTVSTWAKELPAEQIERLKSLPRKEVQVYKRPEITFSNNTNPIGSGRVAGGNFRGRAYEVGEPKSKEKQLYILELSGKAQDFVEGAIVDQKIYKVGLSAWPTGRKLSLNSSLPNGRFSWFIRNTTNEDGHNSYSNFKIAKAGEDAMKDFLAGKHRDPKDAARHLGGEFYLTDEKSIDEAWGIGRREALDAEEQENG